MSKYIIEENRLYEETWIFTYQVEAPTAAEALQRIIKEDLQPISKHRVENNFMNTNISNIFRLEE